MEGFLNINKVIAAENPQTTIGGVVYSIKPASRVTTAKAFRAALSFARETLEMGETDGDHWNMPDDGLEPEKIKEMEGIARSVHARLETVRDFRCLMYAMNVVGYFRAIYSVLDSEGKEAIVGSENQAFVVSIFQQKPELFTQIYEAGKWPEYDAELTAAKPLPEKNASIEEAEVISPNE